MRANGVAETLLHRRRATVREVQGVGGDRPALPAQSALPLDAPRAEALLRHRRAARRIVGATGSGHAGERAARSRRSCRRAAFSTKFDVKVRLHDRRPGRRSRAVTTRFAPPTSATRVYPTFRPDRALDVHLPAVFNPWVDRLAATANIDDRPLLDDLLDALRKRHDDFPRRRRPPVGPRPLTLPGRARERAERRRDLRQGPRRPGRSAPRSSEGFSALMMHVLRPARRGEGLDQAAAPRRAAQRQHARLRRSGRDTGYDSIGDWPQADALGCVSRSAGPGERAAEDDRLQREPGRQLRRWRRWSAISRTAASRARCSSAAAGGFSIRRKGWSGRSTRSRTAACSSHFVGMLTDSRSFMSFPRHEYFRRVLCNLIGRDVESGELPDDPALVGRLIEDVCSGNARRYFGWEQCAVRLQLSRLSAGKAWLLVTGY